MCCAVGFTDYVKCFFYYPDSVENFSICASFSTPPIAFQYVCGILIYPRSKKFAVFELFSHLWSMWFLCGSCHSLHVSSLLCVSLKWPQFYGCNASRAIELLMNILLVSLRMFEHNWQSNILICFYFYDRRFWTSLWRFRCRT